jgi:hypothetical protein
VPWDYYEMIAAIAPRGFFTSSPLHDANFDVAGVRKAVPVIQQVYDLFNAPSRVQARYPDGEHDFPPAIREEAYAYLDEVLERAR